MKRLLIYFMLFFVISDAAPLCQFLKLPILLAHYQEHKKLNTEISFVDFLSMHYWGDDLNDDDDERDMQLPFKKFDLHVHNFVFLPFSRSFSSQRPIIPLGRNYATYRNEEYYNPTLNSLFRPPRA